MYEEQFVGHNRLHLQLQRGGLVPAKFHTSNCQGWNEFLCATTKSVGQSISTKQTSLINYTGIPSQIKIPNGHLSLQKVAAANYFFTQKSHWDCTYRKLQLTFTSESLGLHVQTTASTNFLGQIPPEK
jgi:hypothetical protein